MKHKNPFIDESAFEGDDTPKKSEDEVLMDEAKQHTEVVEVKTYMAQTMRQNAINIFEIDENLTVFSESIKKLLVNDFAEYGVALEQFFVTTIVKPDGDRQYEKFKELHFRQYADIAEAKLRQQIGVIDAQTEAQKVVIDSQAQATKRAQEGYTYQQERGFDVAQDAARNEASGQFTNMGIGLGTGYLSPVKTLMLWFKDKKGLATGLAVAGFGAAKAIATPIMEWMLENLGDGAIYKMFFILAGVYFVMMFIGHLLLKKPEGWHEPQKAEKEIINYIDKHPEDKLDASLLLSRIYLKNNKNTESLNLLIKLNNEYPDDGTILTSLADHYKNIDNDSLYEKYSLDAVKSATFNATTAVKIIRPILSGYVQNTDTAKIQPILNTLNQIYPNESPTIELYADVYKALKDTTNWRSALYELQKIRNNDKVLDFQLVTLAESLLDNKEIYRLTKEGYNKYGDDTWAYYYIISLTKNDMTDSLISESNRLLPLITTSNIKSRIYQIVGDTYSSQSQDTLAMAMYDSCLVYDPNNSGALNNVAYNITKQPNPDLKRAEKMAARALELDPESIYILDTYAWILFLQGDNFLSEFYFDKLLRIEKEQNIEPSIETLYHLGCLYLKTNRIEQAKKMWYKALELYNANPNNFNEKEIITTIQNFFIYNK
mgnify:CR=1 FL=1